VAALDVQGRYDKFPSPFFAANQDSSFTDSQIRRIGKFSLAVVEFRRGQFAFEGTSGKWAGGDLAGFMEEDAAVRISQKVSRVARVDVPERDVVRMRACVRVMRYRLHQQYISLYTRKTGAFLNGTFLSFFLFASTLPLSLARANTQRASTMYERQRVVLKFRQPIFLKDTRHCKGFTQYPMDVDEDGSPKIRYRRCRWDFRKKGARDQFVKMVDSASKERTDGIFVDNGQSVSCDGERSESKMSKGERRKFMNRQLVAYRAAFRKLVANKKYPILSTTNGAYAYSRKQSGASAHGTWYAHLSIHSRTLYTSTFVTIFSLLHCTGFTKPQVPWEKDCPGKEGELVKALRGVPFARNNEFWMWNLGDLAKAQILNTMEEAERGIPTIVHQPYFPSGKGCLDGCKLPNGGGKRQFTQKEFLEFGMAAFLVSFGKGSYFGFSNMENDGECGGWCVPSWPYYAQYDAIVTGKPLGAATVTNNGYTFTRQFEKGTVTVNVAKGTYAFNLT